MRIPRAGLKTGSVLVYQVLDPKRNADLWYLKRKDDGGYEAVPFLQTPAYESEAALSPDGRYLACVPMNPAGRKFTCSDSRRAVPSN